MTDQEKEVLEVIKGYAGIHKYSPTSLFIGLKIGKSRQRVDQILKSLVKKEKLVKIRQGLYILI